MKKIIFLLINLLLLTGQVFSQKVMPTKTLVGISPYIENGKPVPGFVYDIHCLDSTDCVAIASDNSEIINIQSYLIKSTDGGRTWNVIFKMPRYVTYSCNFAYPSKNHIYVATDWGTIFRITDGGKTYDTTVVVYFEKNPIGPLVRSISMSDSLHGIASNDSRIWITNDGWKTFRTITNKQLNWEWTNGGSPGWRCYAFDSLNFLVTFIKRDSGVKVMGLARTTDGGKTWKEIPMDILPVSIYFQNRTLGWAVGRRWLNIGDQSADVIYKTTDGGFTWTKVLDEEIFPKFGLRDICFVDSLRGYAVGAWGKVLVTYYGGKTWYVRPFIEASDAPTMTCAFAGRNLLIGTFGYGLWLWEDPIILSFDESEGKNAFQFFAYPNPFSESVTIRFNSGIDVPAVVELYDAMGNLIERQEIEYPEGEVVFAPTDRSEGVYFYRIKAGEKTFSGSLLKVK